MKTGAICTFVFLLTAYPALAGDHIIVVDSGQAMRTFLNVKKDGNGRAPQGAKLGLGLRPVKRQKRPLVQKQIEGYLNQIPNDGSRVYVVYYHAGIARLRGRVLATPYTFDELGQGKRAAIMQARKFDDIVPGFAAAAVGAAGVAAGGALVANAQRNNHLWSSFHKALEFAERAGYYVRADPKNDKPAILPSVVLITDESDDQRGAGAWNLKQVRPRGGVPRVGFNIPPGGRGQPDPGNLILSKHDWLFGHANAVWYQYGYFDLDSKDWQGKIVRFVNFKGPLSQLPLVNPPVIELAGKQPGKQIVQIKANELITLNANGDARYFKYLWSWKPVDDTRFSKVFPGPTYEKGFRQPGLYTIRVEGVPSVGDPLAAEIIVEVKKEKVSPPVAGPVIPVPPGPVNPDPDPPMQKLVITAKFKLQIDGPDKKPNPIKMDDVLWIFDPKGIKASFTNETVVEGNAGKFPPEKLGYDWTVGGAVPGKYDVFQPPLMKFKAGKYTIGLAASQKDKPENTKKAEDLRFEVRQVLVKPSVKDSDGKIFKTKLGQAVEFELNATSVPPGTTYKWDFGDGTPVLAGENQSHPYMMPSKDGEPFQPKVTATLPDGQEHTLEIATLVEVTKDMIEAQALPGLAWPGEEVTLKLKLGDIDPKEIKEVKWTVVGEEDTYPAKPEQNFEFKHRFKKPGQTVTYVVYKHNTNVPITGKLDVEIREVKPQIQSETKEVFIGQPIDVTVSNAEGQSAFPKDHDVKFTGDGLIVTKTDPKKMFFTEPGEEKEIEAEVILSGISFKTAEPVKIKVKGITPKIGIKAKK